MTYTLAEHGDGFEQIAWPAFLQREFPAYQEYWQRYVVPLTNRPRDVQLQDDASLAALGKGPEDVAMAQLHYTVFRHLLLAHAIRQTSPIREAEMFMGLSALVGSHDVAFELLERFTHRGNYDPWLEGRPIGSKTKNSGQDAQSAWKRANKYPLQVIRDYRNKVVHGRVMPRFTDGMKMWVPSMVAVDKYCDWRTVTAPDAAAKIPAGDFEPADAILEHAWRETLTYFEQTWHAVLLV